MKKQMSYNMINDIILTFSLLGAIFVVGTVMHFTGLAYKQGIRFPIFFVSCFVMIKLFYNIITHVVKRIREKKGIRD